MNDDRTIQSIDEAIQKGLEQALTERDGLKRRMDDVISRTAMVGGNDIDDYLTRDSDRSAMLKTSDADIMQGERKAF